MDRPEWLTDFLSDIGNFFISLGDRLITSISEAVNSILNFIYDVFPFSEEVATFISKIPTYVEYAYKCGDSLPPVLLTFFTLSIVGSLTFLIIGRSRVN